jgi:hypothetical protein
MFLISMAGAGPGYVAVRREIRKDPAVWESAFIVAIVALACTIAPVMLMRQYCAIHAGVCRPNATPVVLGMVLMDLFAWAVSVGLMAYVHLRSIRKEYGLKYAN